MEMGKKPFTNEQNDAARRVLQELINSRYGTRTAAATALGVRQPTVTTFLSRTKDLGPKLIAGLMRIAPDEMNHILASRPSALTVPPCTQQVESAIVPRMRPKDGETRKQTLRSAMTVPPTPSQNETAGDVTEQFEILRAANVAVQMLVEIDEISKGEAWELIVSAGQPADPTALGFYVEARKALRQRRKRAR
jgi:hypothetical protein